MKHESALEKARVPVIVQLLSDDRFLQRMADLRELIAQRAYELFAESGFTNGHDLEDWLRAEAQFLTVAPVEIVESAETLTVKTALPGWNARDIEIHVEPQRLFISAQTQENSTEKKGDSISSEQRLERMFRSLDLPVQIDPKKVKATFSSGELKVELPKAKQKVADDAQAAA